MSTQKTYDFVIVGGGIVGLSLARELAQRRVGRIAVLEKETTLGRHASGRNSGVVHAGIYYPPSSMKAQFCVKGHDLLLDYVRGEGLPVVDCGKVVIATREENIATLDLLFERAAKVGAPVQKISRQELKELEPAAGGFGHALWSPGTSVIHSGAVLERLSEQLKAAGVELLLGTQALQVNAEKSELKTSGGILKYGHLVNAAGVYADQVAHWFGVGQEYRILPFKGIYFKSTKAYEKKIKRLIYPAPDVRMPFLGVHVTLTVDGHVLFGPTAIPALGRENYSLLGGMDLLEVPAISWNLLKMLAANKAEFRSYVKSEISRYRPKNFYEEARTLVPDLQPQDIEGFYKVGIRAQLLNLKTQMLEMDFVLRKEKNSLHVLNAISPAFTSAFAFAPALADMALGL